MASFNRIRTFVILLVILFAYQPLASAQFDWLSKKIKSINSSSLDTLKSTKLSDTKIAEGLKETLKIGIENTVKLTGKTDGYFSNESIKIELPESVQVIDKALRIIGFGEQIDEFILSMNRAAEKSAPFAEEIFIDALLDMSFDDIQQIYQGGDTAATEYFKNKTYRSLSNKFKPVVNEALKEYDVTDKYQQLLKRYENVPFSKNLSLDLDQYVISKALDGLYIVLGEQESKIRTDPTARVTDLLKEVFK